MKLGTRGSRLALTQASLVKRVMEEAGLDVKVVEVETLGDRRDEWKSIRDVEGDGLFTRELDAALLEGEVDIAVHSMKDVPTEPPDGIAIAAVPPRGSPRDALCGGTLDELPDGATVGTGSPRRRAQLLRVRPDLEVVNLRGNVETRLSKVGSEVDAVVLAEAGLDRLNVADRIDERLPFDGFLPAPGQGAIAVSAKSGSREAELSREAVDHEPTRLESEAERALLNELGTGCVEPVGALAELEEGELVLRAGNFEEDRMVQLTGEPSEAEELGRRAARELK